LLFHPMNALDTLASYCLIVGFLFPISFATGSQWMNEAGFMALCASVGLKLVAALLRSVETEANEENQS
jgi:hypothetical protein